MTPVKFQIPWNMTPVRISNGPGMWYNGWTKEGTMNLLQMKFFIHEDASYLEQMINQWLIENSDIIVFQILQSESGKASEDWAITVSIWYQERQ